MEISGPELRPNPMPNKAHGVHWLLHGIQLAITLCCVIFVKTTLAQRQHPPAITYWPQGNVFTTNDAPLNFASWTTNTRLTHGFGSDGTLRVKEIRQH